MILRFPLSINESVRWMGEVKVWENDGWGSICSDCRRTRRVVFWDVLRAQSRDILSSYFVGTAVFFKPIARTPEVKNWEVNSGNLMCFSFCVQGEGRGCGRGRSFEVYIALSSLLCCSCFSCATHGSRRINPSAWATKKGLILVEWFPWPSLRPVKAQRFADRIPFPVVFHFFGSLDGRAMSVQRVLQLV